MNEGKASWPLVAQQSAEELKDQVNNLMEQANEAILKRFQAFLLFYLDRLEMDESSAEIWKAWINR